MLVKSLRQKSASNLKHYSKSGQTKFIRQDYESRKYLNRLVRLCPLSAILPRVQTMIKSSKVQVHFTNGKKLSAWIWREGLQTSVDRGGREEWQILCRGIFWLSQTGSKAEMKIFSLNYDIKHVINN